MLIEAIFSSYDVTKPAFKTTCISLTARNANLSKILLTKEKKKCNGIAHQLLQKFENMLLFSFADIYPSHWGAICLQMSCLGGGVVGGVIVITHQLGPGLVRS